MLSLIMVIWGYSGIRAIGNLCANLATHSKPEWSQDMLNRPPSLSYDIQTDALTIEGVNYSGDLFRQIAGKINDGELLCQLNLPETTSNLVTMGSGEVAQENKVILSFNIQGIDFDRVIKSLHEGMS